MSKDYYEILGVSKDAGQDEIRRAFRRLAKEYHPDRNPDDPSAEAKFKEINEAYEVLSDPSKRSNYDAYGNPDGPFGTGGGSGPFSGEARLQDGILATSGFPSVMFSALLKTFHWRRKAQGKHRACARRDLEVSAEVTLEEAFQGWIRI